jgi:hypothetical protein
MVNLSVRFYHFYHLRIVAYFRSRLSDTRVILETQPVSHYVEKVRWAMDMLNEPYEEQPDAGIIMLLLTARFVSYFEPILQYVKNDTEAPDWNLICAVNDLLHTQFLEYFQWMWSY